MSTTTRIPLEKQARWAETALQHSNATHPCDVIQPLNQLLTEISVYSAHPGEHPAAKLLIGVMAECAGLNFTWPSDAQEACMRLRREHRAESRRLEIVK